MEMEVTLRWIGISIGIFTIMAWVWRVVNWVWITPKKLELSTLLFILKNFRQPLSLKILIEENTTLKWIGISIGIFTIMAWVWRVVNWVWITPKKLERCLRKQGFTGNPYRLLYGDQKEMSKMLREASSKPINLSDDIVPRVIPFIHQTIKNYGKNSFIWMGTTPRVNIVDPELLKDVLNNINTFHKPVSNPLTKSIVTGLVGYEGDQWVKHRRIVNPAFHLEKLKHMVPTFYLSCSELVSKWEELVSKGGGGSCELDVWPYLENMAADAISRTSFGSSYEEGKRIFHLLNELSSLTTQVSRSFYIPGWRFLPTKTNKRMKKIDREIEVSLNGIIKKREMAMREGGEARANNNDLLGILMESSVKEINEHGNDKKFGMSIKEVIEECKIFYFAGNETTSVLLVWTMILLSIHQDWQSLAREEVLKVFGNDKPNYDGLNHLKIVTMILYEVLRLYPPVIMLTRAISKDTKLGNMVLPAGVEFSLPIIISQHDQELWGEDAKEFKPERFSEGVSKATKNQVSFYPFSWGPRICIGQNFAMAEAKTALVMILQRFSFELSPTYAHAPLSALTTKPQYGAHIILHKLQ